MSEKIFTFWEPFNDLPGIISLCLKTWEKHFDEKQIIKLDYSNLFEYLPKNELNLEFLSKNFSLPKQADAIRAAILACNEGGIWLDTDTIIYNKNHQFFNSNKDLTMFSKHIGALNAKANSKIIKYWHDECKRRIAEYKKIKKSLKNGEKMPQEFEVYYLGNGPVNDYCAKYLKDNDLQSIVGEEYKKTILEGIEKQKNPKDNYEKFYFYNNRIDYVKTLNPSIVMLHNSWTPKEFLKMSEEEILNQDNTISSIFKNIFEINDDKRQKYYANFYNISKNCDVVASSNSNYYPNPDDAKNITNAKLISNDFAFHTALQKNPFIIIDLACSCEISHIEIKNRIVMHRERATNLEVYISNDAENYEKISPKNIWENNLAKNITKDHIDLEVLQRPRARFVKIMINDEKTALHLAEVNIYSKSLEQLINDLQQAILQAKEQNDDELLGKIYQRYILHSKESIPSFMAFLLEHKNIKEIKNIIDKFDLKNSLDEFKNDKNYTSLIEAIELTEAKKTAYIHIGTEKTGTTSIQGFLKDNKEALSKYFYITKEIPEINQYRLGLLAYDDDKIDSFRLSTKTTNPQDFLNYKINLMQRLKNDLEDKDCVLFTSELFQSRLINLDEIKRFKEVLNELGFDEIKIIVYLREQGDLLASLYSEAIKWGEIDEKFDFSLQKNLDLKFIDGYKKTMSHFQYIADHKTTLQNWSQVFGKENIIANIFDRKYFVNGDLIDDFLAIFGIEKSDEFVIKKPANEALDAYGLQFLNTFNALAPMYNNGTRNLSRGDILYFVNKHLTNKDFAFSLEQKHIDEIRKFYKKDNEFVAKKYFNNKKRFTIKNKDNNFKAANIEQEIIDFICDIVISKNTKLAVLDQQLSTLKAKNGTFEILQNKITQAEKNLAVLIKNNNEAEEKEKNLKNSLEAKNKELNELKTSIANFSQLKEYEQKRVKSLSKMPVEKLDFLLQNSKAYHLGLLLENNQLFKAKILKKFGKNNPLSDELLSLYNKQEIYNCPAAKTYFEGLNYLNNLSQKVQAGKIAIIVPIYNVKDYLEECVRSILAQTYTNISILLINDGSTDESLQIAKQFALLDERIIVIDKENGGLGNARNVGTRYFQGEYKFAFSKKSNENLNEFEIIKNDKHKLKSAFSQKQDISPEKITHFIFLDSDDYLNKDAVEQCIKVADNHDVVWFDASFKFDGLPFDEKRKQHHAQFQIDKDCILTPQGWLEKLKRLNKPSFWFGRHGMIRADFLAKTRLEFIDDIIHEDEFYGKALFLRANSVYVLNKALYNYRIRPNSIMSYDKNINASNLSSKVAFLCEYFDTPADAKQYYKIASLALSAAKTHQFASTYDSLQYTEFVKIFYPNLIQYIRQYLDYKIDPLDYKSECENALEQMQKSYQDCKNINNVDKNLLIIVPMYFIKEYLAECIDSVLNQEYKNFTILLINDGSTDESLELALEYSKKHKNIIVIDKNNEGQGVCRNLGIDLACENHKLQAIKKNYFKIKKYSNIAYIKCDEKYIKNDELVLNANYLMFLDADDTLSSGCFARIMANIKDADVAWFDFKMFGDKNYTGEVPNWNRMRVFKNLSNGIITKEEFIKLYEANKVTCFPFMVDGFISVELLRKTGHKIPPTGYAEDHYFGLVLFLLATKICVIKEVFYNYRVRSGSSCNFDNQKITLSKHIKENAFVFANDDELGRKYYDLRGYLKTTDKLIDVLSKTKFTHLGLIYRYYNIEIIRRLDFYNYSDDVIRIILKLNQELIKHQEHTRAPEILHKLSLEYRIGKYLSTTKDTAIKRFFTLRNIVSTYQKQKQFFKDFAIAKTEKATADATKESELGRIWLQLKGIK